MDERDSDRTTSGPRETDERQGISRRALLGSALAGAAALPIASKAANQLTPAATPVATPAPSPTVIPISSTDTWDEPWTWHVGDWPGQQLDLNVVENESPGPIVGYGNISAVPVSYTHLRAHETVL